MLTTRRIGSALKGAINLTSVEGLEDVLGLSGSGRAMSTAEAWRESPWYRRAADRRANAVAGLSFTLTPKTGEAWDTDRSERPPEALKAYSNLPDFLYLAETALTNHGKAYALITRDGGRFTGLQWWASGTVREHYRRGALVAVSHRVGQRDDVFAPEDVLRLTVPSPYVEQGGGDPVGSTATESASVLVSLAKWLRNFIRKGLIKAVILLTKHKIPEPEKTSFLARWRTSFAGDKNAGEPIILNEAVGTLQEVGGTFAEMGERDIDMQHIKSVAAGLGMNDTLLQSSAANRATRELDEEDFLYGTLFPEARRIARQMNDGLFEGEGLEFAFQFSRAEIVQRREAAKAEKIALLVSTVDPVSGLPIMSREEARDQLGLTDADDGTSDDMQEPGGDGVADSGHVAVQARFDPDLLGPLDF